MARHKKRTKGITARIKNINSVADLLALDDISEAIEKLLAIREEIDGLIIIAKKNSGEYVVCDSHLSQGEIVLMCEMAKVTCLLDDDD